MVAVSPPVTLLWGEDAFLLREAALTALGDLRATEVDAAEWEGSELQDLATPSLFGEPRALLVTDARSLTKDTLAALTTYLEAPDPDATLIICCQVAERGKVPAALGKLVKNVGVTTSVAIQRKELEPWVAGRAKGLGLDMGVPGARALVEILGEEPGQLVAALQQLASAFPGQKITPQLVAKQFRGLGEQKAWDLCDKAFSKDLPGAIRSLRSIEEGGDDALKTLGAIASRLRDLIKVRALPERTPPAQAAKAAGLRFEWQGRRYQQQARNFSMARLLVLHERVTEADRALKSGATGDIVMPVLITQIAA
ncbi:MAG TPA: DNA polymerase III subunit delta [Actinomycetota bacterium]